MTVRKKALILTADAGFGHRSAANAVAAAMQDAYAEQCEVEVLNPLDDRRTPAFLRDSQADYDYFVRQMPDLWRLNYNFSGQPVPAVVMEQALTVLLFRVMRSVLKNTAPDVVVCTHPFYMAPMNAYITLRSLTTPYLTAITDLTHIHRLWFNRGADLCLVPTEEAYQQARFVRFPANRLEVTGIPVNPAFVKETRSKEELRAELGWAPGIPTALVVGSRRVRNLMGVLHILNHSGLPLQLVLVAGGDDELYAQLKATEWHTIAHVYNFVTTMPQFMRAADLVISKAGGLVVTESLACGLPLLLIDVTPGQEEGNASYVIARGASERAADPAQALETLYHWLDRDRQLLDERAEKAGLLGRARSAYNVAGLAFQAAQHGRMVPRSRLRQWAPRLKKLLSAFDIPISD
jgi:1,2-diacylglycerol 3-beta-galactosyltransferase